ncbi:MAG TPA: AAA family ATPase [Solirubrobacterales bacterium]
MTDEPYRSLQQELEAQLAKTARFIPAAFHVHSIDSYDWGRDGDPTANDRSQFEGEEGQDAFLDRLAAAGLELVVITDHMKCAYACDLARRAQTREDITVFPGMEVSCRTDPGHGARIHFLVGFAPGTPPDVVARLFHNQQLPGEAERNGSEEIVIRDLAEFSSDLTTNGGILIFAHADEQSRGHRSYVRRMIGDTVEMFAIDSDGKEVERDISDMYWDFLVDAAPTAVEVRDSDDSGHYGNFATSDGRTHTVACVAQSDFHTVESFAREEAFTHLKVSRIEFDCVKDALRFRDTRVRFADELSAIPTARVVGMRLRSPDNNGLFRELTIAFNENLNCIIGARGCGKSTVIEALRYVLGQRRQLRESSSSLGAKSSFAGLALGIGDANLADTQIELIYETGGERHVLSATYDGESDCTTSALTLDGSDCQVGADAISRTYPALIFSWGELETLGRDPRLQRMVVDRLSDKYPELDAKLGAVRADIEANREMILQRALADNGGVLRRYSELRARFERMNTEQVAELFVNLDSARERINSLDALDRHLDGLLNALKAIDPGAVNALPADLSPDLSSWWIDDVSAGLDLDGLRKEVEGGIAALRLALEDRKAKLAPRLEAERRQRDDIEERLRQETEADASVAIQSQQREEARRRYEEARALRERYLSSYEEFDRQLVARAELLDSLRKVRKEIATVRREIAETLTNELADIGSGGPVVSILVEEDADRAGLEAFFAGGFLSQERAGQWRAQELPERLARKSPVQTAWAILAGTPESMTGSSDGLSEIQAKRLVEALAPFVHDEEADLTLVQPALTELLQLQEQPVDDVVRIYSDGEPVDKLSPGGRSSAMLPLIALSDTAPLIIDQPEDNLDNRMVGNTLSSILARLKERRQIIVTTHNPNIVVGGDAEQVIVLKALGDRSAELEETGNIDEDPIIDAVIKIMEGGKEAFKERKRRYGSHLA